MTIGVDFDGTIVTDAYPQIGKELPFAIETLKMLQKDQHRLILWTVREGKYLQDAIDWCKERGVEFYAVNRDYPEEEETKNDHYSRKLKVDMWIDDRNIGGLPDWGTIYNMVKEHKTWKDIIRERAGSANSYGGPLQERKKKWWQF
ncbi:MAG: hypothetical protein Q4E63_00705 [Prevotellaceae bacterium]|nr:hypothetical protein [Prevotellaceae bacterium]MDO4931161.1 hypothetical protein [Prevotellaceae bacterium]